MLSIPFFCLPHPFFQLSPTEWMSGLKEQKTLCQAITVQNYRPPAARTHRTWIQSASVEATPHVTSDGAEMPTGSVRKQPEQSRVRGSLLSSGGFLCLHNTASTLSTTSPL